MRRRKSTDGVTIDTDDGKVEVSSATVGSSAYDILRESLKSNSAAENKNELVFRIYIFHLVLALGVLVLGMMHNVGNKKYVPVNARELMKLMQSRQSSDSSVYNGEMPIIQECKKAYVNVHSTSIEEDFAVICCHDNGIHTTMHSICHPEIPILGLPVRSLPFSTRLTRFTEAWILPLLPVFIRLIFQVMCALFGSYNKRKHNHPPVTMQREETSVSCSTASSVVQASSTTSLEKNVVDKSAPIVEASVTESNNITTIKTTLTRLFFYFALLNFRGFGLYVGANAIEDYVFMPFLTGNTVTSSLRINSLSDVEHNVHSKGDHQQLCWYEDALKAHHKMSIDSSSECYGRPFDFSDHVVLFLAHYLPVLLMEMIICYRFPFWQSFSAFWYAIHASMFVYLHLLVLHSAYQTAVYFHTQGEIIVGYAVSLIVQIPLCYLMCREEWARLRHMIGIQNATAIEEKSD